MYEAEKMKYMCLSTSHLGSGRVEGEGRPCTGSECPLVAGDVSTAPVRPESSAREREAIGSGYGDFPKPSLKVITGLQIHPQ